MDFRLLENRQTFEKVAVAAIVVDVDDANRCRKNPDLYGDRESAITYKTHAEPKNACNSAANSENNMQSISTLLWITIRASDVQIPGRLT